MNKSKNVSKNNDFIVTDEFKYSFVKLLFKLTTNKNKWLSAEMLANEYAC